MLLKNTVFIFPSLLICNEIMNSSFEMRQHKHWTMEHLDVTHYFVTHISFSKVCGKCEVNKKKKRNVPRKMSLICRFEWKIIHLKQSSKKRSTRQWAPMMMTMMFKTIIPYNENDKWWKRAKHTLFVCVCVQWNTSTRKMYTRCCIIFVDAQSMWMFET